MKARRAWGSVILNHEEREDHEGLCSGGGAATVALNILSGKEAGT